MCVVHEPVNIGASGGRATVMGAMPHPEDTEKEVMEFVKVLLEHDRIDLDKKKKSLTATHANATDGKKYRRHARRQERGRQEGAYPHPLPLRRQPLLKERKALAHEPALALRTCHQHMSGTEGRFPRSSGDLLVVCQARHIGLHFFDCIG